MPGATRRSKPLKAKTVLADVTDFSVSNPADGDLLVFSSSSSLWQNSKTLTGDYTLAGLLALTTLTASGLVAFSDDLTVAQDLTVDGAAILQGTADITGAAILSSTLAVAGAVTLSDALTVTGTLTGAGFSFSADGTMAGTLGVTGVLSAAVFTAETVTTTGAVVVGDSLSVAGVTVLSDDLSVDGNISAGAIASTSLSTTGDFAANDILATGTLIFGGFVAGVLMSHDGTDSTTHNQTTSGEQKFTGIQTDGSTTHTLLTLDPDADAELYHNNVAVAKTNYLANGGFFVNNTLTGGGYERVLTIGDGINSLADATLTSPVTGALLVKTSGVWVDSEFVLIDDTARKISLIGVGFDKDVSLAITSDVFEIRTNDFNDLGLTIATGAATSLFFAGVATARTASNKFELWDGSQWNQSVFAGGAFHDGFSDFASNEHFTEASIDHTAILNIGSNTHAQIDTHLALVNAHLDWTSASVGTIHATNYVDNDTTDHTALSNIGTNTHVQIDTHIANAGLHFSEASIDHTNILNIGSNTHSTIDSHIADATLHFAQGGLDDNTDVTLTTPATGAVLYKSAGDWLDTPAITIDPAAAIELSYNGSLRLATTSTGALITVATGDCRLTIEDADNQTAHLTKDDNGAFVISNTDPGGQFLIQVRNAADNASEAAIQALSDGAVNLFYNGLLAFDTTVTGITSWGAGTGSALLRIKSSNSSRTMWLGFNTAANLELRNFTVSGWVVVQARDAGSTDRLGLVHDPDAGVQLYHTGSIRLGTTSIGASITGSEIELNNSAAVTNADLLLRNSEGGVRLRADGDIFSVFQTSNTGGVEKVWISCLNNSAIELSYDGAVKFKTVTGGCTIEGNLEINGQLNHDGGKAGFFGAATVNKPTGVAVTAAGIHAALVTLGLIA